MTATGFPLYVTVKRSPDFTRLMISPVRCFNCFAVTVPIPCLQVITSCLRVATLRKLVKGYQELETVESIEHPVQRGSLPIICHELGDFSKFAHVEGGGHGTENTGLESMNIQSLS